MVILEEKLVNSIANLRRQDEEAGRHSDCCDDRRSGVGVVRQRLILTTVKKAQINHVYLGIVIVRTEILSYLISIITCIEFSRV